MCDGGAPVVPMGDSADPADTHDVSSCMCYTFASSSDEVS